MLDVNGGPGKEQEARLSHLPADISEFCNKWSTRSQSKDERFKNVHCALM